MMNKKYAVMKMGEYLVENTIVAPSNFIIESHVLIEITKDNPAQPGAFYNPKDGRYYGDIDYNSDFKEFKTL
ncbi:hypothetical protein ACYDMD_08265 [Pantoea agglomerans]